MSTYRIWFAALLAACAGSPTTGPGNETVMSLHAGASQTGLVGTAVPIRPAVLVTLRGEPVAGVTVTFRVVDGGGTLLGATQVTNADGIAKVDAWILGSAGPQALEAVLGDALASPVLFAATAKYVTPAIAAYHTRSELRGTVGLAVTPAPRIRVTDAQGRPVAGVPVSWTVSGGGGISYADRVTNEDGVAGVGRWILGLVPEINTLTATTDCGVYCPTLTFIAHASAGPPYTMTITAGDLQQAPVGAAVAVRPTVELRDAYQNAADAAVTFSVVEGGGSVTGGEWVYPDNSGNARVGSWILGPGQNVLRAESHGLSVLFRATGVE